VTFAGMLRRAVLGCDVVARLGGDEFIVILHDIESAANAEVVVRRLREEMEMPVMIGDTAVRVRSAIGITIAEPGEYDGSALLRQADQAMYENKHLIKSGGHR
jgi:diguanylate cyclase (GGDEF)-like protein